MATLAEGTSSPPTRMLGKRQTAVRPEVMTLIEQSQVVPGTTLSKLCRRMSVSVKSPERIE